MKISNLAKAFKKDYQFINFFSALKDAEIMEKDAAIIRQLFGEILAGIAVEEGHTGFKPVSLSYTKSLTDLWVSHGLYTTLNGICIAAIKRGAAISQVKRFARAYYNEEKYAVGYFVKANILLELANEGETDEDGAFYKFGTFDEDNRLIKYRNYNVYKVGRAYFVEGIRSPLWPCVHGWMWVPTKRLKY